MQILKKTIKYKTQIFINTDIGDKYLLNVKMHVWLFTSLEYSAPMAGCSLGNRFVSCTIYAHCTKITEVNLFGFAYRLLQI